MTNPMNKQITAKISLSQAQWALLTLFVHQGNPMLPKNCWDVGEEISKAIEEGLVNAKEEN